MKLLILLFTMALFLQIVQTTRKVHEYRAYIPEIRKLRLLLGDGVFDQQDGVNKDPIEMLRKRYDTVLLEIIDRLGAVETDTQKVEINQNRLTMDTITAFFGILNYLAKMQTGNKVMSNSVIEVIESGRAKDAKKPWKRDYGGLFEEDWTFNMLDAKKEHHTYTFDFYKGHFVSAAGEVENPISQVGEMADSADSSTGQHVHANPPKSHEVLKGKVDMESIWQTFGGRHTPPGTPTSLDGNPQQSPFAHGHGNANMVAVPMQPIAVN